MAPNIIINNYVYRYLVDNLVSGKSFQSSVMKLAFLSLDSWQIELV